MGHMVPATSSSVCCYRKGLAAAWERYIGWDGGDTTSGEHGVGCAVNKLVGERSCCADSYGVHVSKWGVCEKEMIPASYVVLGEISQRSLFSSTCHETSK